MKSLRRGLTVWLWAAVAIVGLLCLAVGNWQAHKETQAQLDYQMQQVAQILAAQEFPAGGRAVQANASSLSPAVHVSHDDEDNLIVTVRNAAVVSKLPRPFSRSFPAIIEVTQL